MKCISSQLTAHYTSEIYCLIWYFHYRIASFHNVRLISATPLESSGYSSLSAGSINISPPFFVFFFCLFNFRIKELHLNKLCSCSISMRIEFDLRKMKRKDGTVSTKSLWTERAEWKSGLVGGWMDGWVVQSMSRSIVAAIEQLSYANLPEASPSHQSFGKRRRKTSPIPPQSVYIIQAIVPPSGRCLSIRNSRLPYLPKD